MTLTLVSLRNAIEGFFGSAKRSRRKSTAGISCDPLESRRLLATLVNATTVTYRDFDGDNVSIVFSKPILTSQAVANSILTFSIGEEAGSVNGSNADGETLESINLASVPAASGTSITSTAVRSPVNGGDGFAAIGQINATGRDLGNITIDGDLGRLVAGDATLSTAGVGAIKIHSLGRYGTYTGAFSLRSVVNGPVTSLTVKTDVRNAVFEVTGGSSGKLGPVTIGGSLIGGPTQNTGSIRSTGDMATVKISGDIRGGAGLSSGAVVSSGKIASVTVGGALVGGSGGASGMISSKLEMGSVTIAGNVIGGSQFETEMEKGTGLILSNRSLGSITIGGSIVGGTGMHSGGIVLNTPQPGTGAIGAVKIKGGVFGGNGDSSGVVLAENGKLTSVQIGGSLRGGIGEESGRIYSLTEIASVTITGDVIGRGSASGTIHSRGKLKSATIGGSLIGGDSQDSGNIVSTGNIGTLKIAGDVIGGTGYTSGCIISQGGMSNVAIGGSLIGGWDDGGIIDAELEITSLTINGDIQGGSGSWRSVNNSGVVEADRIGALTIGGSLIAGMYANQSGVIQVTNDIATMTIKGSIVGNETNRARITARGQASPRGTTDVAIGKLTVNGRVEYAQILAGIGPRMSLTIVENNADAQIGEVVVGQDWIASDLAAGTDPGDDQFYGTDDDQEMRAVWSGMAEGFKNLSNVSSKIASITIGGRVVGADDYQDYGFAAQSIGMFKVKGGSSTFSLRSGNGNDEYLLDLFGNIRLNEY